MECSIHNIVGMGWNLTAAWRERWDSVFLITVSVSLDLDFGTS
jgi:hypothetical protein